MCDWYEDGDSPEVIDTRIVTARKEHRCCECGERIELGQSYQRVKGLWNGQWDRFAICEICAVIRDTLCPGAPFEGLRESLHETYDVDLV